MILDGIVFVAIIISAIIAFLRGFIRELLTIVGVVGGLAASYFWGPVLVPITRGWLGVPEGKVPEKEGEEAAKLFDIIPMTIVADVLAYGMVFLVVVILLSIASHMLSGWAKAIGLGPVDRTLGVVFGIARAVLLLSLLYLPVYLLTGKEERDGWFKGSHTRLYIEGGAKKIAEFLPEGANKDLEKTTDEAGQKMNETRKKLEEMKVLESAGDKIDALKGDAGKEAAPTPQGNGEGYRPEDRQTMDQLIESNEPENYND